MITMIESSLRMTNKSCIHEEIEVEKVLSNLATKRHLKRGKYQKILQS
jgi:hypothetical protein